jgi:hypothetical protein
MELTSLSKLLILLWRGEGGHGTLDDVMIVRGVPLESVERICARLLELLVHAGCPKYIVLKDYADQYLNVQLTDVAVILKARMLYDVYSSGTAGELSFSVLRLKTGRTYGINLVGIMPTHFIERIQKLRHRPLPSEISLSWWLKDIAHVDINGFRAMAG